VLRIEDTDAERSSDEMVEGILRGLRWLGLNWDEGPGVGGPHAPYFQAQRLDRYRAAARRLVQSGHAYYCYCSPDELQAKRAAAEAQGTAWMYDRTCRRLSSDEIARREAARVPRATRFLVPEGRTTFADLVHGDVEFDNANIEDFVILRSDDYPTYHLSVVVDDVEMQMTHIVRGDDHVSNTPKQVLLYAALGAPVPAFAHVPLILGPDKKRLSKRHGATSVGEYEHEGILPDAMVNFLALLGWSPGTDQELFTREELIAAFDLSRISGGNAVFNPEKLRWFNQQYILKMPAAAILDRRRDDFSRLGVDVDTRDDGERQRLERIVNLFKPRAHTLPEIVSQARLFFDRDVTFDEAAVQKHLGDPSIREHLDAWRGVLSSIEPFTAAPLEAALRDLAASRGLKAGPLIHATRVAVTGQAVSPGLFDVLELLGREKTVQRIGNAVQKTHN
jgi:glutamyl-tRNA synthetase